LIQHLVGLSDRLSTFVGKACAWLIAALMALMVVEVVKRYLLGAPSDWSLDISCMLYGSAFMMCGAYTLAQNAHVRGDLVYHRLAPRTQAWLDLALYALFFMPGLLALCIAGWEFAHESWVIREHSNIAADGPAVYPFKALIPVAGALVVIQGLAEMLRCVACIRAGKWLPRLSDVEEIDIVDDQLALGGIRKDEST
jgi:TRAP-type mannitol/chloroaromatic compound transport system permease small subunit